MIPKKKKHSPSKKAKTSVLTSEDQQQIQQLLHGYQSIVTNLFAAQSPEEAETALTPIEELSRAVQMAFTKSLSNAQEIQAADLLTALHALARHKEVRKEAKRSLLRLASANIEPDWSAPQAPPKISVRALSPIDRPSTEEELDEIPDLSEISEEDEDPLTASMSDTFGVDWDMLLDQMGEAIKPWLDAEEIVEMRHAMLPEEEGAASTFGKFFDAFTDQMYEAAFNLLATDSPLQQNLSQQEWVRRYNEWSVGAQPGDYDLYILYKPWYEGLSEGQQGFELYWSLHIDAQTLLWEQEKIADISLLTLPVLHRYWFRSRAVIVEEDGESKLYALFDYSSSLRDLSDAELDQRWVEARQICESIKPLVNQQLSTDLVKSTASTIAYQQRLIPLIYLGMERTRREPANSEIYDTIFQLCSLPSHAAIRTETLIAFIERKLAHDQRNSEETLNDLVELYTKVEMEASEAEEESQVAHIQERLEALFTRLFQSNGSNEARLKRLINRLRNKAPLGEVEPEIQAFETNSIDPDLLPEYTFQLGQYYLHYERLEQTLSYLLRAEALGYTSHDTIGQIAEIQIRLKQFKNAIATLQKLQTHDYDSDLLLARALLELGQYKKALVIAEKRARQFDEMALPAALAAMASYRLGNTRVARNYLRAAEKNEILEPEAHELIEKAQHLIK